MPLPGSVGGVLWGSWDKATLANSNQKEQCFGKLLRRSYPGAHKGKILGGRGECLLPGPLSQSYQEFIFPCTLQAVICGTAWGRDKCQSRAFAVSWPCRMEVKAGMLWNSVNSQQWGKTIICQEWKSRKPN